MVDDWWQPFKQDELIRLLTESGTGVVHTPGELLRVVAHAITLYEASLRGIGGGVELLWAEDRPRQETVLSIDLARFLKQHFAGRNIVLNREVEVKPASENPILEGERSDILVQATEVGRPTVSLVVEIKGSWNPEKYTGYERQLVTRYLASPEAGCGLHVVFWFDRDSWDIDDSRRKNSPKDKLAVVRQLCSKRPLSTKPIDHVVIDAGRAIQQA